MALMTKLQRKYIKDIESNLSVTFNGKNTRNDADLFIKQYVEENRKFQKRNNKQTPPTGKQLRLIKDIEEVLDVEFIGKTLGVASNFIKEYFDEFKVEAGVNYKIKNYYNKVASGIELYQNKRKLEAR